MKTYNTYQEAKIDNPTMDILVSNVGKFHAVKESPTSHFANGWKLCNPDDHCVTVEQFLSAGYKFVEGDVVFEGVVKDLFTDSLVRGWNKIHPNKVSNAYILRAAALDKPEVVEWKNGVNRTVYGVGYLDEGPYLAFTNGEPAKAYYTWANMLKRCYCESSLKARPTYKGCSVCDEWHSFQNFAAWFYEYNIEGHHLDKDVLIDGNKEYSPEACSFISHADNNIKARAKHYTFYHDDFGLVDIYNLNAFCKQYGLNSGHMCSVNSGDRLSHKGWKKPESPQQKLERERLEAAYDLYTHVQSVRGQLSSTFDWFLKDQMKNQREKYLTIVDKTNYRKGG